MFTKIIVLIYIEEITPLVFEAVIDIKYQQLCKLSGLAEIVLFKLIIIHLKIDYYQICCSGM